MLPDLEPQCDEMIWWNAKMNVKQKSARVEQDKANFGVQHHPNVIFP